MAPEENWNSLPGMMLSLARKWPERPMLRFWRGGSWHRMTWAEYAMAVASVAAGLRQRGVCPGDRVLLVSENRPEFIIADTAIMAIGARAPSKSHQPIQWASTQSDASAPCAVSRNAPRASHDDQFGLVRMK